MAERQTITIDSTAIKKAIAHHLSLTNFLIALKGPVEFECEYQNWRGEVETRRVRAIAFWHGSTEWHPTPGLMLKVIDLDKIEERDFAVADINTTTLRAVQ